MKRETCDFIKEVVRKVNLLEPESLNDLIKILGGKLIEDKDLSRSGSIKKLDNRHFIIRLYNIDNKLKVGEMIGHLLLHMGYKINDHIWNSQKRSWRFFTHSDQIEQAVYFSWNLLIPEKYTSKKELNKEDIDEIKDTLSCSYESIFGYLNKLDYKEIRHEI